MQTEHDQSLRKCLYGSAHAAAFRIGAPIREPRGDFLAVRASTVADYGDWQTVGLFGALIVLALGIALQVVVAAKPRPPGATEPELGVLPVGSMKLGHER